MNIDLKKELLSRLFLAIIILLPIVSTYVFADFSKDNAKEILTISKSNMMVRSSVSSGINITFVPIKVTLTDKIYEITLQNLENQAKNTGVEIFYEDMVPDMAILQTGTIKFFRLVNKYKFIPDVVANGACTVKEQIRSKGEINETVVKVNECRDLDNGFKRVDYTDFEPYHSTFDINEPLKDISELTVSLIENNGLIRLEPLSSEKFLLSFNTKVAEKSDGTFGGDGIVGLKINGVKVHPPFNQSYRKVYRVDITAGDALNKNFTHNISFAFTGNSTEIGSGTVIRANLSVLACNNVHIVFNDSLEIDREIEACNSSQTRFYFGNQINMTRNQTLSSKYSIYYHPVDAAGDPQPPRDWSAIWMSGSTHFDDGQNDSRYFFDNSTRGNSTWRNFSSNGYVELRGEDDPNDGCLVGKDVTNTTEPNIAMEFLILRANNYSTEAGNKAFGLNDRPCHISPNTDASGFFIKDSQAGLDDAFSSRSANFSGFTSSNSQIGTPEMETWQLIGVNRTTKSGFNQNITGFFATTNSSQTKHDNITANVPNNNVPLRPLLRSEKFTNGPANFNIDEIKVIQLIANKPSYLIYQHNTTVSTLEVDLSARACTAENSANSPNSYSQVCDGIYQNVCNSTGDLLSCDDGNVETQTYQNNKFGGVHIQSFNSSVTNCEGISDVFICYEWWASTGSLTNCLIAVDANANASYQNVTDVCPLTTANPSQTCINVVSLENWTCSNFFGSSGTRAVARNEISKSPGSPGTLSTDALFFKVIYSPKEPPNVTLVNPPNDIMNVSKKHVFFSTTMDNVNLNNATLYHNISGSWIANQTLSKDGLINESSFKVANIVAGIYIWNVQWCDTDNNCAFASSNYTFEAKVSERPFVTLNNPPNSTTNTSSSHIFLSDAFDDTELANATLYHNISGSWIANQTMIKSGTSNISSFIVARIADGGYVWNVQWCNSGGNCSFATSNNTFTVNNPPGGINLTNPPNGTSNKSRSHIFESNASDSGQLVNATLYHNINGTFLANQTLTIGGNFNLTNFSISRILPGTYLWNVKWCDAYGNCSFAMFNNTLIVTDPLPTIISVDINSTDPATNNTDQNITIYPRNVSANDDDTGITNITNWLKNGASLTILNLAFDTNATKGSNVRDYSGNTGNGTINTTQWNISGINGGAYRFATSTDKIILPETNDLHLNGTFAIEAWFNLAVLPGHYVIIGKRIVSGLSGWKLSLENGGSLPLLFTQRRGGVDYTVSKTSSGVTNTWRHVAVNWNGTNLSLWIDGLNIQSTQMTGNLTSADINAFNITIGDYAQGGGVFNGFLDNIRIYNNSLSDEQIRLLNSSAGSGLTIVSQETGSAGENWSACVTPNDAKQDGATVCSQNLTIG